MRYDKVIIITTLATIGLILILYTLRTEEARGLPNPSATSTPGEIPAAYIEQDEKADTEGPFPTAAGSGIAGTILVGPSCPVARVDTPCPDTPFAAEITILRDGTETEYAKTYSNELGTFSVSLAPGKYKLRVRGDSAFPKCTTVPVIVQPGQRTKVTIMCDSGIR